MKPIMPVDTPPASSRSEMSGDAKASAVSKPVTAMRAGRNRKNGVRMVGTPDTRRRRQRWRQQRVKRARAGPARSVQERHQAQGMVGGLEL
jgi:hypothetical protein